MPPTNKKPQVSDKRPVKYPEVFTKICHNDDAITAADAKEYLGWLELPEKDDREPLLTLPDGTRVICTNNQSNRPFEESRAELYAQTILTRKWAGPRGNGKTVNGEALVIGRCGQTLSCQHRMIALILAVMKWQQDEHWKDNWPTEPVLESVMTFGVDESGETTGTIDNVKPRTGADVFFSDPTLFPEEKQGVRKSLCKILDFAVKLLWFRTGAKHDPYSPFRTHSESKEFIKQHPSILECVKHIHEQDSEKSIANLIGLGTAAGLMYLMGVSNTDGERDSLGQVIAFAEQGESAADMSLWAEAKEFWSKLSEGEGGFKFVRNAIGYLRRESDGNGGSTEEKIGLIVKAWLCYSSGGALTEKALGYVYETKDGVKSKVMIENGLVHEDEKDEAGNMMPIGLRKLTERPSCGGVDLGNPDEAKKAARDAEREQKKAEKKRIADAAKALGAQSVKDAAQKPEETRADILSRIRKDHPEKLLIWVSGDARTIWGSDAIRAGKILGLEPTLIDGMQNLKIEKDQVKASMKKIEKTGAVVGVCGKDPANPAEVAYLGDYIPGGYAPLPEPSPAPAAPLPRVASKPVKATVVKDAPKPEPEKKAPQKAKGAKQPVLRGGTK